MKSKFAIKLKKNNVFVSSSFETFSTLLKNNNHFVIPLRQRGLSPKFPHKRIMFDQAFEDISVLFRKNIGCNLQLISLEGDFNTFENTGIEISDGFQRLNSLAFLYLLNYREAILSGNDIVANELEKLLFHGPIPMRNAAGSFVIRIDSLREQELLTAALKGFFAVLAKEESLDNYSSFSGSNHSESECFSKLYLEEMTVEGLSGNAYAWVLYNFAKELESGFIGRFLKENSAVKISAELSDSENYKVEEELYTYLNSVHYTFSVPPKEIDKTTQFERLNTPGTALEQYELAKNVMLAEIESLSNKVYKERLINLIHKYEENVDTLSKSESTRSKLRLMFLEFVLHTKLDNAVVMTSAAGKINETVLSFFREEIKKNNFNLEVFLSEMIELTKTRKYLKQKNLPKEIRGIAFLLQNTKKMDKRYGLGLIIIADRFRRGLYSAQEIKYVQKLAKTLLSYRLMRFVEGTNVDKGSEILFSFIAINTASGITKSKYDLIVSKINSYTLSETVFKDKFKTWQFDYSKSGDVEAAKIANWLVLDYSDKNNFDSFNCLDCHLDHTIPVSFTDSDSSIRTSGISKSLKSIINDNYYTSWVNFAFVFSTINIVDLSHKSQKERIEVYKGLPFDIQKKVYGEINLEEIRTKEEVERITSDRKDILEKALFSSMFE